MDLFTSQSVQGYTYDTTTPAANTFPRGTPKTPFYTNSANGRPLPRLAIGIFLKQEFEAKRFKGHTITHEVLGHGFNLVEPVSRGTRGSQIGS